MSNTRIIDHYTVEHRGVSITVQKRTAGFYSPVDYGYKTSTGITGIGQKSAEQAETDARHAIDKAFSDEAQS